jgi:hypothetical protein
MAMRRPPVKIFVLAVALGGVVTALTGLWSTEPDDAAPPDLPWADADGSPSSPGEVVWLAKRLVARDVAIGRRSLLEAAALFRDLPKWSVSLATPFVEGRDWGQDLLAETEEERLCIRVIGFGRAVLWEQPDVARLEAAQTRLEGEFWGAICEQGAIRLPDVSPAAIEALLKQARDGLRTSTKGAAPGQRPGSQ